MPKPERNEALERLNKALREDEKFRVKFTEIMGGGEKVILQAIDPSASDEAEVSGQGGCSCWAYCCGTGCNRAPNSLGKGYRVG